VVSAGSDQTITLPVNVVQLAGTATDDGLPSGSVLKTAWSVVSGPSAVQFGDSSATNTTALFTAAGVYGLRLTADDSQYRSTADVTITVNPVVTVPPAGSIVISPASASPVFTGGTQQFQAAVKDGGGTPVADAVLTITVSGANGSLASSTTDANGIATFSYGGTAPGVDTIVATTTLGSTPLTSNTAVVNWVAASPQVTFSPATGQFFPSDGSGVFDISAGQEPAFSQTFDAVKFNPAAGTVPGAPNSIDVTTRPFTNVTTDANGNFTGSVVAQGNGLMAGVDTLATFQAVFTGTITVATAGTVTFNFTTADGFVFGIGNGAPGSAVRWSILPPRAGQLFRTTR
jgi:K319L-like, PKD domain